ncbi:MAG: hypothetical protein L0Z53_17620, partial [Acidobacteriales bacterium]|nr:hypothetical protein [Terriglobales bacterium]
MRIGWLQDPTELRGGAEHEADELLRLAPNWAEIIPCPAAEIRRDVDAYVIQNCGSYTEQAVAALRHKPVIKRIHDAWDYGDDALRAWLLSHAKLLFFSGPLHVETFRHSVGAPLKYLPSAIDARRFRQAAARSTARSGAIWLGRLYPGKGLHLAAEWARGQDGQVDVYGFGALADRLPDSLRYCGEAHPDVIPHLLAGYETFVFLPDAVEPFGRTAVEAWL